MKYLLALLTASFLLTLGCESGTGNDNGDPHTNKSGKFDDTDFGERFQKYFYENMEIHYTTIDTIFSTIKEGTKDVYWSEYGWKELQVTTHTATQQKEYLLIVGDKGFFWNDGDDTCYRRQSLVAPFYQNTNSSTEDLQKDSYDFLLKGGFAGKPYTYIDGNDTTIAGINCRILTGDLGRNYIWYRGMVSLKNYTTVTSGQASVLTAISVDTIPQLDTMYFRVPDTMTIIDIDNFGVPPTN